VSTSHEQLQRRTVRTLVLTQATGALGMTIGFATASLLAQDISGSKALSGLSQTAQVLGAAVISFLLAPLMARRGRRVGLMTGYAVGALGAGLAVLAGVLSSFPVLLVGATLLGAGSSANNASRYAATDLATDATRARSLAVVVWASTIGAVAGPNLTGPAGWFADVAGIPELTGPFAFGAFGLVLAAIGVAVLLRPDPLLLARREAGIETAAPRGASWGRAWTAVRAVPMLGVAIAALALAHATMIGVMLMTPLHMHDGGAELRVIGLVISVHVLGMFAFAPVVGILADRVGRPPVLLLGGLVLITSLLLCASSPDGMSWQITSGLFLLGVGWSCAMVSASTMVADHAPIEHRTDVQGTSDLVMGLTAAVAGALSGVVVDLAGYRVLALVTLTLALGVVAAALAGRRLSSSPASA
jgi:MFS family permease